MTSSTDQKSTGARRDPFLAPPLSGAARQRASSGGFPPRLAYFLVRLAAGSISLAMFAWARS